MVDNEFYSTVDGEEMFTMDLWEDLIKANPKVNFVAAYGNTPGADFELAFQVDGLIVLPQFKLDHDNMCASDIVDEKLMKEMGLIK